MYQSRLFRHPNYVSYNPKVTNGSSLNCKIESFLCAYTSVERSWAVLVETISQEVLNLGNLSCRKIVNSRKWYL